jgi:Fumarylacetoacetate (FAA) hydrolase family
MKLCRYGPRGHEKPGMIDASGKLRDLSLIIDDIDPERLEPRKLVSYVSEYLTLLPGDVIATGTPPCVGMGKKPEAVYLEPGDIVTLGIGGLGEQRQKIVAYPG